MLSEFYTWETLLDFGALTIAVFMIVQFTKEKKYIKKIPTKYWSLIIALIIIILTNIYFETFRWIDIIIYLINAVFVSLATNGAYNFILKKDDVQLKYDPKIS